jgi:hypothetical protein
MPVGQQEGQGHLAAGKVGSQRLSRCLLGPENIQAIVEHLVGGAEGEAELAERGPGRGLRDAEQGPDFAGQGEELGRLQLDDPKIVLEGLFQRPLAEGLQDLPGTDRLGGGGDDAADLRAGKLRRQAKRVREQAIAEQHRRLVAEAGSHRRALAPDARFVDDVVVNQRGEVDQLDDGRAGGMGRGETAGGGGTQGDEDRPQLFATGRQGVARPFGHLGLEGGNLRFEEITNFGEERLGGPDNLLPATGTDPGGPRWAVAAGCGGRAGGQHRRRL